MTRSTLARAVLSGTSALVIGFGARSLTASPATQTEGRPYCSDQANCQATCERLYPGFDGVAVCSSGHTCYCYFARGASQASRNGKVPNATAGTMALPGK
jgi:hypothetical protein